MIDSVFILKFIKFCLVGGSGVFVDFGITYLCKEKVRINKYLASSIGFICAATSNYILNRIWTFSSNNPDVAHQYFRFIGFAFIGLLINNAVIYLLNGKLNWNFYFTKLIATGVVTIWNFTMNYLFTF